MVTYLLLWLHTYCYGYIPDAVVTYLMLWLHTRCYGYIPVSHSLHVVPVSRVYVPESLYLPGGHGNSAENNNNVTLLFSNSGMGKRRAV